MTSTKILRHIDVNVNMYVRNGFAVGVRARMAMMGRHSCLAPTSEASLWLRPAFGGGSLPLLPTCNAARRQVILTYWIIFMAFLPFLARVSLPMAKSPLTRDAPQRWVDDVDFAIARAFVAPQLDHVARARADAVAAVLDAWGQPRHLVFAGLFIDLPPAARHAPICGAAAVADLAERAGKYRAHVASSHALIQAPFLDLDALILLLASDRQRLMAARAGAMVPSALVEELSNTSLPLLKRLGIWDEKRFFEDELFALRDWTAYSATAARLQTLLANDAVRLEDVRRLLERVCRQALGTHAGSVVVRLTQPTVVGAQRRIDNLRELRHTHLVNAFDLVSFDVLVETVGDCYTALAAVHSVGWPVGDRFSDFIAAPKFNGYSALMTTVALPLADGHRESCQVRVQTQEMATIAGRGALYPPCAAAYRRELPTRASAVQEDVAALLASRAGKALMAIAGSWGDAGGGAKGVTSIDVYTMTGDRRTLPLGATALDFAFSLHTDIGLYTAGVRVNGAAVPLNYRLDPGDVVQFTLAREPQVRESWLEPGMIMTPGARRKVRHALYRDKVIRGRQLLRQELERQRGIAVDATKLSELVQPVLGTLGVSSAAELCERIGNDRAGLAYRPSAIAERIGRSLARAPASGTSTDLEHWEPVLDTAPILDTTMPGRSVRLCRRCRPRYPDQIAGRLTSAATLVVHRVDCPHLVAMAAVLPLTWRRVMDPIRVRLWVTARDRSGLLHDLTGVISRTPCYLRNVHTTVDERSGDAGLMLDIHAPSTHDLVRLRARLCRVRSVRSAEPAHDTPEPLMAALQQAEQELRTRRRVPRVATLPPPILINPYNVAKPASRSMFFGRENDVEFLRQELVLPAHGQAITLYGPWRAGKTSLALNFLPENADTAIVVRASLLASQSANERRLLDIIADHLSFEFQRAGLPVPARWDHDGSADMETAFTAFLRAALAPGVRRLVLVLDEFGAAIQGYQEGRLDARFFDYWKTLLESDSRLSLLFVIPSAVRQRLAEQRLWSHLTYARPYDIGFLDRRAARQLLVRPLSDLWVHISPEAVEEALDLTGCSPYHLVLLGQQIVQRLPEPPHLRIVDRNDVRVAAERLLENEAAFRYLLDERSPLERRVLSVLAERAAHSASRTVPLARLVAVLREDEATIHACLQRLWSLWIVKERGNAASRAYQISIELFRQWLVRNAGNLS